MTDPRNVDAGSTSWIDIRPNLMADAHARNRLRRTVRRLINVGGNRASSATIANVRQEETTLALTQATRWVSDLILCINVLCDLRAQGWTLRLTRGAIEAAAPLFNTESVAGEKDRVRDAHLVERDAQLAEPAVARFVREMERRRLFRGEWHSVFSLMRDGRKLASQLAEIASEPVGQRSKALQTVVDPYIQVVDREATCAFTGLALSNIWRYFRHTWTTTYQSTPGRKMFFLIRDRAAPNHPVVGIGALGSAIVQLSVRDEWIGWTGPHLIQVLRRSPSASWARWLDRSVQQLIDGIMITDFVRDGDLRKASIKAPTEQVIDRLRQLSKQERRIHQLYPALGRHKSATGILSKSAWREQAKTHLFRSKRAKSLADLLEARLRLQTAGFTEPTATNLRLALADPKAVRAIQSVLRQMKATHVGIDMMDITVCGAIAPYNRLIGGKLVSLLMASPIVVDSYNRKYSGADSVIASSIAGRPVHRTPRLVLLGTTSLYGVGASQYNRLRLPAEVAGGCRGEKLEFIPVGKTVGYGSYHFSSDTMAAIDPVLRRQQRGRPVNSIFGEGVNPRLRKVRSALDAIGFPSDVLLRHGSPRIIYGVPLASNFRDVLVGRSKRPKYILPTVHGATDAIVKFWLDRWLSKRIENDEVLADVSRQTRVYPVTHGARVNLPQPAGDNGPLFEQTEKPVAESEEVSPSVLKPLTRPARRAPTVAA